MADDLPAYLSVQAALIWIATRNVEACQEGVANEKLGLQAVSTIVEKYSHPRSLIIRDKAARFEIKNASDIIQFPSSESYGSWDITDFLREKGKIADIPSLDSSSMTGPACICTLRMPDNPPVNYAYAQAERELSASVRAGDIVAHTNDAAFRGSQRQRYGHRVYEIDAAHWTERELKDEVWSDGHYHVVAAAAGLRSLRHIQFKTKDVLGMWPPNGGRKRGPKAGRPTDKDDWCSMAIEILDSGKVLPGRGDMTKIAKLILEKGRYPHALRTITKAIGPTVNDWKRKHAKAA